MAKAKLKTTKNDSSVEAFLNTVADEQKRADSFKIVEIMQGATGDQPKMWGDAIVGFGEQSLKYDSGRELDMMIAGFSPRKNALTLYIPKGSKNYDTLMAKLGKYTMSKWCVYVKRLADINEAVLGKLVKESVEIIKKGK